jgi:hypothetical protein
MTCETMESTCHILYPEVTNHWAPNRSRREGMLQGEGQWLGGGHSFDDLK